MRNAGEVAELPTAIFGKAEGSRFDTAEHRPTRQRSNPYTWRLEVKILRNILRGFASGAFVFGTVISILSMAPSMVNANQGCVWQSTAQSLPRFPEDVAVNEDTVVGIADGSVVVSHNGIRWSQLKNLASSSLNGITWTGHRFLVVGDNGTVLSSENGINWERLPSPGNVSLLAVAGFDDKILVSGSDGFCSQWTEDQWTVCSFPDDLVLPTLAAGPAGYVAVDKAVWFSPTGETWKKVSPASWGEGVYNRPEVWDVIFDGSMYWVLYPYGLAHSVNGYAWEVETVDLGWTPDSFDFKFLPRGSHGDWIVGGIQMMSGLFISTHRLSDNSWPPTEYIWLDNPGSGCQIGDAEILTNNYSGNLCSTGPSIIRCGQHKWRDLTDVRLRNLRSLQKYKNLWLATTCSWDMLDFRDYCHIYTAPEYGSWQLRDSLYELRWIVRHNDQWVANADYYQVETSSDLENWHPQNITSKGGVSSGDIMLVFGYHKIASSSNLEDWSIQEREEEWNTGVWTGSRFVLCGDDGVVGTSTDAETWSVNVVDPTIDFKDLVIGNDILIMTGSPRTSYRSIDGGQSWQAIDPWSGGYARSLVWIGDRFMACSNLGCRESTDGLDWQPAYSKDVGRVYWGGVFDGEVLFVAEDGRTFSEMCPGEQRFPAAKTRVIVPIAASVEGALDSTWSSKLELLNPTDAWQRVVFSTGKTDTTQLMMPPGMQMRLEDALPELFNREGSACSLEVAAQGQVAVTSAIGAPSGTGRVGQAIPALRQDEILRGDGLAVVPRLEEDATRRSNLGIVNLGAEPLLVAAQFLADDGSHIGELDIDIPPAQVQQLNRVLRRFGPVHPPSATVVLTAAEPDAKYVAFGSIVENQSQDPSFRIAMAPQSGPQILAAAAQTSGVGGISWSTDVDLVNPTGDEIEVEISLLPTSRFQSESVRTTISLPAFSTRHLEHILDSQFVGRGVAALSIDPGANSVLVASRTMTAAGAIGQSVPAVAEPSVLGLEERLVIAGLHEDEERRSNVGIVNLEDRWVEVGTTIFSAVGDADEETMHLLPPRSLTQLNQVLRMAEEPRPHTGWLEIRVSNQPARLLAWSSIVDNTTGDPVFCFATRIDQAQGALP